MGAAAAITAVVASAIGTGVAMNQQKQAEKGAANAAKDQEQQAQLAITDQKNKDATNLKAQQSQAGATQQGALAAIRASMAASTSSGGTVLSGGGTNAVPAPTATKTLLGV